MPTAQSKKNVNNNNYNYHYNYNKDSSHFKNIVEKSSKTKHGPSGPPCKWVPKRLEDEDEDTTDVSASSHGSLAGDEEVPWSCPSEEEESPSCRSEGTAANEDHRNGGQVLLALLQGPSTP